ncbi:MAG: ABC transporter permease [Frankiaceae bacterium]
MTLQLTAPAAGVRMPGPGAVLVRNRLVARRMWLLMASGFFEPVLYLAAMAWGVGALVGDVTVAPGHAVPYVEFVAPALLATSAMNGAVYESTTNVFWKLRYLKVYDAVLASPMSVSGLIAGEICWSQIRGIMYAAGFMLITISAHWTPSAWTVLAVPAVVLVGLAFSGLGTLVTTFLRSWQDMELVTLGQRAMFLCSATFYPLSVYPRGLRDIVVLTPLYHANELLRGLCEGRLEPGLLEHAAYLVVMAVACVGLAARRVEAALRR